VAGAIRLAKRVLFTQSILRVRQMGRLL